MVSKLKIFIKKCLYKENDNIYTRENNYFISSPTKEENKYYKYSEDSLSDIESDFCRKEAKNSLSNEKFTPKNFILKG